MLFLVFVFSSSVSPFFILSFVLEKNCVHSCRGGAEKLAVRLLTNQFIVIDAAHLIHYWIGEREYCCWWNYIVDFISKRGREEKEQEQEEKKLLLCECVFFVAYTYMHRGGPRKRGER